MSMVEPDSLEAVEHALSTKLAAWSAASVAAGAVVFVAGRSTGRSELTGFGRQTAAWGAVDGVIAGVGAMARRRRGAMTPPQVDAKRRQLRVVLLANAAADVLYVAGGAVIASRAHRRQPIAGLGTGDGLAIVMHGAFLLGLDLVHARRLSTAGGRLGRNRVVEGELAS